VVGLIGEPARHLGTEVTLALCMGPGGVGAGLFIAAADGIFFWALGFAAINSMQQARLAVTAPDLASASIALNTSVLYRPGHRLRHRRLLFAHGRLHAMGYAGVAFVAAGGALLAATSWRKLA
jgi:MFS transporter, DHA1 family, inner membrane transport protein